MLILDLAVSSLYHRAKDIQVIIYAQVMPVQTLEFSSLDIGNEKATSGG